MSRRLEGSVRRRGKVFLASIAKPGGGRVECSFPTEEAAWAWIGVQISRLKAGLAIRKPDRAKPTGNAVKVESAPGAPNFTEIAKEWAHERYAALHVAQLERAEAVERDLEMHILPAFHSLFSYSGTEGRRLVINWLRAMAGHPPSYPNSPFETRTKGYEQGTVDGFLTILKLIIAYARARGYDVPDYTNGLTALEKEGKKPTVTLIIDLVQTMKVASHLHVIHQFALWLMRLGGFRISEAYGLRVSDFFIENNRGYLRFLQQGGRRFVSRGKGGKKNVGSTKPVGKTQAAYRIVPIPRLLTEMILVIIEAYHTVDGVVDPNRRLIPAISSTEGGQHGFRQALARAGELEGLGSDLDVLTKPLSPHDLRKNFATDIGWKEGLTAVQCRRIMGQRAGSDVFDLVYRLDGRLQDHLAPVAVELEGMLAAEGITSLIVPTADRPLYGKHTYTVEHRAAIDAVLADAGWQVGAPVDQIGSAEAATILGMAETATRRLFDDQIPAVKDRDGNWRTTIDAVVTFRDRLEGHRLLVDIADEAGVSYHQAYATLNRLGIETGTDEHSRQKLISHADADRIIAEFQRIDRLRVRAMTVADAASALGTRHSSINAWVKSGRLVEDEETDASGKRYVTRASVEAELGRRGVRRRSSVAIDEFLAMTGMRSTELTVLITLKVLIRTGRGHLTRASVEHWMTGYRPDLLGRLA